MLIGITSTPSDGAMAWTAAKLLIAKLCVASRRTATRIRLGAICLSNSNHFALRLNSNDMKPVTLPPGRARWSTYPAPTGSVTTVNTTGTVRVDSSSGPTLDAPPARMTSGASAASSAECLRISVMLGVAQRVSIRRFCPMPQPNMASPCRNAPRRACHTGSSGDPGPSTPIPLALLRVRHERPYRRAADQRDELAPFHCPMPPVLPKERNSTHGAAALRDFEPVNVADGSWPRKNSGVRLERRNVAKKSRS